MPYSDAELKDATQVAYKDELSKAFQALVNAGEKPPFSIERLCAYYVPQKFASVESAYSDFFPDVDSGSILNWQIVDIYDNNAATGFYGCVIDTGDGNAIIAFRGSEGMTDLSNLVNDWFKADLGLLNSTLTNQQAEVEAFLQQINNSDYVNNYNSFSTTGHSLGGNLAMHAAIMFYNYDNLRDKLDRCVSFDGPGFSDEYIRQNRDLIERASGKMDHYVWSIVGGLLFNLPGVDREYLDYSNGSGLGHYLIGRHSTESISFNNDGSAVRGEEDFLVFVVSKASMGLERMPKIVGDVLYAVTTSLWFAGVWMYNQMVDDGQLTPFGIAVVVAAAAFVLNFGLLNTVAFAFTVIVSLVAAVLAVAVFELVCELVESLVNFIANAVASVIDWLADRLSDLKVMIQNFFGSIRDWLNRNFNAGYQYAMANPQITLDTDMLRAYADRLNSVNRRIGNIDSRLDGLYWRVGLLDLWNLMQADLLTGFSWRLLRCSAYLNETADDFKNIEKSLLDTLGG